MMKIVGVGQILDLESGGGVANKMVVRTDDGRTHDVTIPGETAQELLNLAAGGIQEELPEPPAEQFIPEDEDGYPMEDEDSPEALADVFGGDPGEVSGSAVMGAVSEEEIRVPPRPVGLGVGSRPEEEDGVQI